MPNSSNLSEPFIDKIIHRPLLTCDAKTSLQQAIAVMEETQRNVMLVTQHRRLVGLVTDTEILQAIKKKPASAQTLQDCLLQPAIAISLEEVKNPLTVLNLLQQYSLWHLPVVNAQGHPLAVVTLDDLRTALSPMDLLRYGQVRLVRPRQVVQASPSVSVAQALLLMASSADRCLVLTEAQRLVGLLTRQDVAQLQALNLDLEKLTAQAVMKRPVVTADLETSLLVALGQMQSHNVRRLVVVDAQEDLVGVVSQGDIWQLLGTERLQEVWEELQNAVTALAEPQLAGATVWGDEAGLSLREQQYRHILNRVPDFICCFQPDGTLTFVNQAYCDYFGRSPEELLGRSFLELIPEGDRAIPQQHIAALLAGQNSITYEHQAIAADGSVRWQQWTDQAIRDRQGNVAEIQSVGRDITERRLAELALQNSESELRAVFAAMSDLVVILDREGRYRKVVTSDPRYLYDRAAALSGLAVADVMPADEAKYIIQVTQQALDLGQTIHTEYSLNLPDRGEHWFSANVSPLDAESVVWVVRDITERKRLEAELYQYRDRLQDLVDQRTVALIATNQQLEQEVSERQRAEAALHFQARLLQMVDHAVIATDLAGGILHWNDFAARLYGWTFEEVRDRKVLELLLRPEDQAEAEGLLLSMVQGESWTAEKQLLRRDGSVFWALVTHSPLFNQDHELAGMICISIDITDRKEAETALQRAIAELGLTVEAQTRNLATTIEQLQQEIAGRNRAEAELRQREREFRALVENSPDIIARIDRQMRYVYVNPSLERETGVSPASLMGRTDEQMGHSADKLTPWYQAVRRVFETGQEQSYEFELYSPRGMREWSARLVPEWKGDGTVDSVLIVSRDVTALKQAERVLRQQAEREQLVGAITQRIHQSLNLEEILETTVADIRALLHTDRVVIYHFQPDWSGDVVAESVISPDLAIMGWTIHDPCFRHNWHLSYLQGHVGVLNDVNAPHLRSCYVDLLKNLQVQANLVVPILQGDRLWGLLIAHHCTAPRSWQSWEIDLMKQLSAQVAIAIQQSELYAQVQSLNSTLEQQVQERTAELEQSLYFESVLKGITDSVRDSLDEDKILQTAVDALGATLGIECCDTALYNADFTLSTVTHEYNVSLPTSLGRSSSLIDPMEAQIYERLLMGQCCQFCFTSGTLLRGTLERYAILVCPIFDDRGILGNLWLFRYKQERFSEMEVRLVEQVANQCAIALRQSRLYQAAQSQVRELERLNQLKDDFLSTVSHELRTPMANIKMATQMLELQLQSLDVLNTGDISRYFQVLKDEGQREINLINDLLDLTRLDAGTEPLIVGTMDLCIWIPHVAEPFAERMRAQHQDLVLRCPGDRPVNISTDFSYLERILSELLHNACKYTPSHQSITLGAQMQGDRVEIEISNSGVTIPPEECDRIFDKFYRIPNQDPWKYGGTGLGLALVKRFVEHLGGHIQVTSDDNAAHFIISLPKKPPVKQA